jgi:hypothetical protein
MGKLTPAQQQDVSWLLRLSDFVESACVRKGIGSLLQAKSDKTGVRYRVT